MEDRHVKFQNIRWLAEIVVAIFAIIVLGYTIIFDKQSSAWHTLGVAVAVFYGLMMLAYWEIARDRRIDRHEANYVHPAIWLAFRLSFIPLLTIIVASWLNIHWFNSTVNTVLFDLVFFVLDVTGISVVISLFLAILRLNRATDSSQ